LQDGKRLEWFVGVITGLHPNGDPSTPQDENLANLPCVTIRWNDNKAEVIPAYYLEYEKITPKHNQRDESLVNSGKARWSRGLMSRDLAVRG
jgi:hypothetical protein